MRVESALLGILLLSIVIVPWCMGIGSGFGNRRPTVVISMRAVSITIMLLIGVWFVTIGVWAIVESRGVGNGGDAAFYFVTGLAACSIGIGSLSLAFGLAYVLHGSVVGVEGARSGFIRQGTDTHCRKCGFQLIGPGGPCRRCADVKTRPCSSCGCYILPDDSICPYCRADVR